MKTLKIKSVKYNFVMNFILTASQLIFPLVTFPYVSRVLGAAGLGKVSFASSIANYFMLLASLGIPTYGIRACARVRDDKEKLSRTVKEIFIINIFITICILFTYIICIIYVPIFSKDMNLFIINGFNIFLNAFGMNWFFQALEQYDYITIRSIVFKFISIVLMFLCVREYNDYPIYAAITVFAAVGSYIINFVRVNKIIDFKISGPFNFIRHIKPIFVLFAQSLAVSIYTNLDTVMLGFFTSDVQVGYYNAAIKIKTILLSLVSSLGNVLLPRMSYYVKNCLKDQFVNTMCKALNFTAFISIPLTVYFILYAKESILFLAGSGYLSAVLAMQIITIAVIPNGFTGILGVQVLTAQNKEKYVLYSVICGASVDFILNLVLIPYYGAAGTAFATMIAEFFVLFIQVYYTRNLLFEICKELNFIKYFLCSILAGLICYLIKFINIPSSFLALCVSFAAFCIFYFIGLFFCGDKFIKNILITVKSLLKRN